MPSLVRLSSRWKLIADLSSCSNFNLSIDGWLSFKKNFLPLPYLYRGGAFGERVTEFWVGSSGLWMAEVDGNFWMDEIFCERDDLAVSIKNNHRYVRSLHSAFYFLKKNFQCLADRNKNVWVKTYAKFQFPNE